jgi:hypothetical protein
MIFVYGNGLANGFDRCLTTAAITDRVVAVQGGMYTDVLRALAYLAHVRMPTRARWR